MRISRKVWLSKPPGMLGASEQAADVATVTPLCRRKGSCNTAPPNKAGALRSLTSLFSQMTADQTSRTQTWNIA